MAALARAVQPDDQRQLFLRRVRRLVVRVQQVGIRVRKRAGLEPLGIDDPVAAVRIEHEAGDRAIRGLDRRRLRDHVVHVEEHVEVAVELDDRADARERRAGHAERDAAAVLRGRAVFIRNVQTLDRARALHQVVRALAHELRPGKFLAGLRRALHVNAELRGVELRAGERPAGFQNDLRDMRPEIEHFRNGFVGQCHCFQPPFRFFYQYRTFFAGAQAPAAGFAPQFSENRLALRAFSAIMKLDFYIGRRTA